MMQGVGGAHGTVLERQYVAFGETAGLFRLSTGTRLLIEHQLDGVRLAITPCESLHQLARALGGWSLPDTEVTIVAKGSLRRTRDPSAALLAIDREGAEPDLFRLDSAESSVVWQRSVGEGGPELSVLASGWDQAIQIFSKLGGERIPRISELLALLDTALR